MLVRDKLYSLSKESQGYTEESGQRGHDLILLLEGKINDELEAKIVSNRRNNLETSTLRKSLRPCKEGGKKEKLKTSGNSLC